MCHREGYHHVRASQVQAVVAVVKDAEVAAVVKKAALLS